MIDGPFDYLVFRLVIVDALGPVFVGQDVVTEDGSKECCASQKFVSVVCCTISMKSGLTGSKW